MRLLPRLFMSAFALAAMLASAHAQDTLYFSAIPDEDETRLAERFDKVADYLSEQLDVPVQFVPVKSYPAAVTAFRNDQVQLAWFGGLSGVQARLLVPEARAIAQGDEDQTFVSYFIAHTDTGLTESADFPAAAKDRSISILPAPVTCKNAPNSTKLNTAPAAMPIGFGIFLPKILVSKSLFC